MFELKNKAIFLADAHENEQRDGFLRFLLALKEAKIECEQLILMGDIFDLLVGEISATHHFAKPYIELLEGLSTRIEIIYLEGNHDFNLSKFFKQVKVIPIQKQPLNLQCKQRLKFTERSLNLEYKTTEFFNLQALKLSHGDIFLKFFLSLALRSLRGHFLLSVLNLLDRLTKNSLSNKIKKNQTKKNLFYKINNFDDLARQRFKRYDVKNGLVIEGHYHQNFILNEDEIKYINLPSFAYKESFFVVECCQ